MGILKVAVVVVLVAIAAVFLPSKLKTDPPTRNIEGWTAPGWYKVAQAFRTILQSGNRNGGAYAVYYKGEKVVDLWGGYADLEAKIPWEEKTMGHFFSTTKGACAIIIGMLVDRGHLDYEKPISNYWPEFSQNGKENITLRTFLNHQAGVPTLIPSPSMNELFDTEVIGKRLAGNKPLWKPGTAQGYHTFTFGLYVDQIVRRVDPKRRGIRDFFQQEISEPFDIDFYIGLPLDQYYRVARHYEPSVTDYLHAILTKSDMIALYYEIYIKKNYIPFHTLLWERLPLDVLRNPKNMQFPFGSANGFGTARAIAKLYGIIANGGIYKGKQLLSERILGEIKKVVPTNNMDVVLLKQAPFGLGFSIERKESKHGISFGHPGYGGQHGQATPALKFADAHVTNFIGLYLSPLDDWRYKLLYEAAMYCIEKQESKGG